ncbi:MAG TPA: tetraacyldisaccharide 4'-kinase [Bacteroidales bacterium]|nr:tetraacyldisaccharide 4'-kinase [Bacteroidales bacterium]HPJ58263.1 tetraacyldisaccharide 4'-kinase [Bacteroidales bacterium]HPR11594.1 tetraacyldisaccharide 4'-kinase [Bacteroidales bacterium]HRW85429.1 tetraacyldisaccharide 4'-kinase [Bacteroidales bacterium]
MVKRRTILLYPFSIFYGLITAVRNFLYDSSILRSHEFRVPLICVGNLAAGGTGKTPHTEYLAGLLSKNFRVAVLSRGYKRNSKGFRYVTTDSDPSESGDEPYQIAAKFPDITVAVDGDRVRGVNSILHEKPETQVILLDDGFQHRRIIPGLSILLSEYERPFYRDHLLPYGNLREAGKNMRRADIILITKCHSDLSPIQRRIMVREIDKPAYQNLFFTTFSYRKPRRVFGTTDQEEDILSNENINQRGMVLVTGIANPEPLKRYLEKKFVDSVFLSFGDHHTFTEKDIRKISDAFLSLKTPMKYVITTEKDAVRLKEFANIAEPFLSFSWYIPVEIEFLNDDREEFDNLIINYVRKNKRNN